MRRVVKTFLFIVAVATQQSTWADTPSDGEKLFALKVQPIFSAKCVGCHAEDPEAIEGEFDLRNREAMMAGGESFSDSVVIPGDAEASELMALIRREYGGMEMPPKEADKLSEEEIWAIRDWINAGAAWPSDEEVAEIYEHHAEGVTVKTSGGLADSWTNRKYKPEDLWAFQPIRQTFEDILAKHRGDPVDAFIDARLKQQAIRAAPIADRRTLIRRATFDLVGLPPKPAEVDAFVNDPRSDGEAFAALVDRLLESPHYGEQWGRHWLDVVRYADSSGYANDWERPNTWRYRDYVVRAFNNDKPFERFVREQIAGDEIVERAAEQGKDLSDEESTELLIAAGFLRMGAWEHTGMSVAKVTRQLFLDDITDTVGQVFLGQALQCCRCHDHKFDPIPTLDFYSIQSVFSTTQFAEVDTTWLPSENRDGIESDQKYHQKRHKHNQQTLASVNKRRQELEAQWFKEQGLPYESKSEANKNGASADQIPPVTIMSSDDIGRQKICSKWSTRFAWEFDRYKPIAYTVYSGKTVKPKSMTSRIHRPKDPMAKGTLEKTAILTGGDPFSPGEAVKPGVLSAVPGALNIAMPESPKGRRIALADWIVDPHNSLTPRVIANRVWTFHFGRGIAGNPNNFGSTGKKPTHPLLLDWLATEMIRGGWSIKHLHRVIMTSDAYRRSTMHPDPERLAQLDPQDQSYAVFLPRRLEAEEIRDASLALSGELTPEIGGIPIRPDMNLEAALQPRMIMGTFAPSYVPNPRPEQRNRRSIYIHKTRGHRLPFMETFNQPGSEVSCELRDQSNITPQVFAMTNGQESNDRALALAIRLRGENDDDAAVIRRLFILAFSRPPTNSEIASGIDHWKQMISVHESNEIKPVEFPVEVVREAMEEKTGEPFRFTEKLFVYEGYVPDTQPHEVDAKTRALADVCLAILNSNEFIYVY